MKRTVFAAMSTCAVLLAGGALAETLPGNTPIPCAPHDNVQQSLKQIHAEKPVSRGIDARGAMVEVFAAPAGNWTIVVTEPGGMSCLMASGEAWESFAPETAGLSRRQPDAAGAAPAAYRPGWIGE